MQSQLDSWHKSSHKNIAGCVDCHLPQDLIGKYIAKADNGYRHSRAFTFQDFHEPIQIGDRNAAILQANCIRCHQDMVLDLVGVGQERDSKRFCVHCHRGVGHQETPGLGGMEPLLLGGSI